MKNDNIMGIYSERANDINNFTKWTSEEFGGMNCYMAIVKDYAKLDKIAEIRKNFDEDSEREYIELQVSFTEDGNELKEVLMLLQEEIESDWTEPDVIGIETKDETGAIIGHTLLSDEEYKYLIALSTRALNACFVA